MIDSKMIRSAFAGTGPVPENGFRHYAVLVPLIEKEDGLHVLYEVRARDLDRQPGEICFPGGAMEDEESPLETALRETCEEIGVAADDIEIIGQMDSLNNAGLQIDVFVGLLKGVTVSGEDRPAERQTQRFSGLTLSDAEVEDVFTIPLTFFLKNKPEVHYVRMVPDVPADFPYEKVGQGPDYPWRDSRYSVLIYDWPGRYLWGMTAKIVERFVAIL